MAIHVFFLKSKIPKKELKKLISTIYLIEKSKINLLEKYDENAIINYQITKIASDSDFNYQFEIFISNDLIISSGVFNNLILAIKLNKILRKEVLINDESDNPYQWLLINNENLYLVEEEENQKQGIYIFYEKSIELDISKGIALLQNKNDYIESKKNTPYYIKNPKLWLKLRKEF